ncbi:MAG TPA: response regulator transcription factor [Anaerolineales bacterium]|nr:response regulator transcription factor [Anaerolineales bacterium]
MSDETVKILIADDHMIVRQGLQLIFETEDSVDVVGEAVDGLEAVKLAGELHPDLILMDLQMPNMDGLSAVRQIRKTQPDITIIILTTYNEDELMVKCLQAGAKGFLLKDTGREALMNTIHAAMRGETLLKPEIMEKLLAFPQQEDKAKLEDSILSNREHEVLLAAAEGLTNNQIALRLEISERTVRAHLTNVYNKMGVSSRGAAIAYAAQHGLLE